MCESLCGREPHRPLKHAKSPGTACGRQHWPAYSYACRAIVQVFSELVTIVRGWEASPTATGVRLLYSVAYDWRRDPWEQAARVAAVVDEVLASTGCRPIIAAHSFGGLVTYAAFAQLGRRFADKVHGVLYGATPVQPYVSSLICASPSPPARDARRCFIITSR